jgi:branched-chain amino acid transport system substrate-binding protein
MTLQTSKRALGSWRVLLAVALPLMLVLASCGDSDDDGGDGDGATTTVAEDGGATTTAAEDGGATTTAAEDGGATTTAGGDDEGAAAGDDECPDPATGEPIKLGDVTSASGTNIFPESANIAKLVFERYNCNGGLDGRPIELISVDAQDTAEGAAAAARNLAEEQQVLGFCCSGSIVNCFTNAGYYSENGWEVIPGVEACAEAPTVHPVNTGPFLPTYHMLDFFKYDLGAENICFVGLNVPLTEFFQTVIIPTWEADSGSTVNQVIIEVGEDFTPAVTKLAADGCDAVEAAFTEPDYQAFFQIADAQGLTDEMAFGMLTSGYSLQLLEAAGDTLEGVYSNSEFEPYTGDEATFSEDVKDYIALAEAGGQPLTSFGQGGYISANVVIQALESIEGELTKESVNQAFKDVVYETPLLGAPFMATGSAAGIQPNATSLVLQVQDGDFVRITDDWRVFPLPEEMRQTGGATATTEG